MPKPLTKTDRFKSENGDSTTLALPARQRISRASYTDLSAVAYPSAITPDTCRAVMAAAARGRPKQQNDFIDNMIEADPVLAGIYATRLFALSGKRWEIVVEDNAKAGGQSIDSPERRLAEEIADYCSETLAAAEGFDDALKHNADAIGRSYSVTEIIWDTDGSAHYPIGFIPVPHSAVEGDTYEFWKVRIHTANNPSPGELLARYPLKFILHSPNIVAGNPFRGGILRRCIPIHMYRRFGLKWWTSYVEMFGTPYRKATYPKNATPEQKQELQDAMEEYGHLGWGIFAEGTGFDLIEQARGGDAQPHPKLIEAIDNWYAITILGQNLTTQVAEGSFAAAKVHNEVRRDILDADIQSEAAMIRRYLLKPMVELKFGPGAPIPCWRRIIETPNDLEATGRILANAVNQLGMKVSKGYAAAELGIPLAKDENADDPLPGAAAPPASPFGAGGFLRDYPTDRIHFADPEPIRRLPADIGKRISPVRILDGWMQEMIGQSAKQAAAVVKMLAKGVGDIEAAKDGAEQLGAAIEDLPLDSFTDAVHDYLLACLLAGTYNADQQIRRARGRNQFSNEPSFWMQPFRQAIGALRDRLLLKPDDFMALDRAARSRAGRIAGEYNLGIVKDAYASIEAQLEQGGTVRDFRNAIKQLPERDGWAGENTWHANLVFQQNSMMAYHSAHLQRFVGAGVQHWQFEGYDDSCPQICQHLIGKVFSIDDVQYYPPNPHHGCDCWASPLFEAPDEVSVSGDIAIQGFTASLYDPREFAKVNPFRLSSIPDLLRNIFRDFAIARGWEISE